MPSKELVTHIAREKRGRKKLHFACFGYEEDCCVFPVLLSVTEEKVWPDRYGLGRWSGLE